MEATYPTVLIGKRPMLHRLPKRWCLVAIKKGVRHYVKQTDPPKRYFKGPGINNMSGFLRLEDAERWATKPAHRLYQVEDASRNIAICWFEKLSLIPSDKQLHVVS
jgi:hypothetical protein